MAYSEALIAGELEARETLVRFLRGLNRAKEADRMELFGTDAYGKPAR